MEMTSLDGIEKYILLMFGIKRRGKEVTLEHILEKSKRDLPNISEEDVRKAVENLLKKNILLKSKDGYILSDLGFKFFDENFQNFEEELLKINKTWTGIYKAKKYYSSEISDVILQFCKNRHVGFYCTFTEKHFFRRKFKDRYITINSKAELLRFVNMFCIDIIPCVHEIGSEKPSWLVIDIDAGKKVEFSKVKEVTKRTYEIMEDYGMKPKLKFSGSRGFQLWCKFKSFNLPYGFKDYFSLFVEAIKFIQRELDKEIPGITTFEVHRKELREDKILLDWSCMKRNGLVRVPYGIHHKTFLVSMPLSIEEIENFNLNEAKPENVLERYRKEGNEFRLEESKPSIFRELQLL